jgi:phage terminase large subunit-like protein
MSSTLSLEQRVALMPPPERQRFLDGLDMRKLRWSWNWTAMPNQLAATESAAAIALFLAGRGAGKTRTGAEKIRRRVTNTKYKLRILLVARTAADVRDVMVNGDSGIMSVFPRHERPRYIASQRRVEFANGCEALMFTAEEPSQLRGPQGHLSWADEVAAWDLRPDDSGLNAWDNLVIATRLPGPDGTEPQIFATTTPKKLPLVRDLYSQGLDPNNLRVELFTGKTRDNVHLSSQYLANLEAIYKGTRLAAQELDAEVMMDVEGALWMEDLLNEMRVYDSVGKLPLRVVGVDPTTADRPRDECGIVVVGATSQSNPVHRTGYVLGDYSMQDTPSKWAAEIVRVAKLWDAPVVAESNQGGAMVREVIKNSPGGKDVQVRLVHAKQGKALRAEPVSMAYDQKRVIHNGRFPELEDQMTTWVPGETAESPDRVDALVHGLTALVVPQALNAGVGGSRLSAPARKAPPIARGASTAIGRRRR